MPGGQGYRLCEMAEVLFYHLERGGPADVLPGLLERTLSRGWSAVIRCADEEELRSLDDHLWTYQDESFLPHGAGAPDPRTPIWLTAEADVPEDRDVLFALTSEGFAPESHKGLTRAVLMFAESGAPAAREAWKSVKAAGLEATYWKQDPSGKWVKAG
ncbi:MAG: DNA polymerase III subunit chi [Pseudomonadota bacterium]